MTMKELLVEAMTVAGQVWNGLPKGQDHLPVLLTVQADGARLVNMLDVPDGDDLPAATNQVIVRLQPVRSALIAGVWFTTPEDYPAGSPRFRPREHPARREAVTITSVDHFSGAVERRFAELHRNPTRVGKWETPDAVGKDVPLVA